MTDKLKLRCLRLSCLLVAAAGAWISGQLVEDHANVWAENEHPTGLFARVCAATAPAGSDCHGANHSPWSSFAVPIPVHTSGLGVDMTQLIVPVAFVGLAYFVVVATWLLIGPTHLPNGAWRWLGTLILLGSVSASFTLLAVMATGRSPWCVWCVAVHALNLLLTGGLVAVHRASRQAAPEVAPAVLTGRAVLTGLLAVVGLWIYRADRLALQDQVDRLVPYRALVRSLRDDAAFLRREFDAQPVRPQLAAADRTKPQLVMFIDYECSACYCKARTLEHQLTRAMDERVEVTFRHYPLDGSCNPAVTHGPHGNACAAARAAEAARQLGGEEAFRRMHEELFKKRKSLADDLYPRLAAEIGLDPAAFADAMASPVVTRAIEADVQLGHELGVSATPTLFLNGRHVPQLCDTSLFWTTVVAQLPNEPGEAVAAAYSPATHDTTVNPETRP